MVSKVICERHVLTIAGLVHPVFTKLTKTATCIQYEFMREALFWNRIRTNRSLIMNKVLIGSILACGLLLLESPEAAAHDEKGRQHRPPAYSHAHEYRRDSHSRDYYSRNNARDVRYDKKHNRANKMPKWLKHDRSFRRWLDATGLDRNRYVTWHQLFDIYSWERSYLRNRRY